ncbi:MAG TPA: DUF1802 family protein [Nodularia sp. (in: cyanobacteria)]|nr:DUF1802 family protein [Nodularia sp. (in: cyanobacteria)]
MELTTTSYALKEWAIAVNALEKGKTIMFVRKGGIHEHSGHFKFPPEQILLYPTYEHQQACMLKAEYTNLVSPVTPGWHPEKVTISSWAKITDILPIIDESIVHALLPFHIWNERFISDVYDGLRLRLKFRITQPIYILLLRVYKLPQTAEIFYRHEYDACKSWIDLGQSIPLDDAEPVLSDFDYTQLTAEIYRIVVEEW